MSRAAARITRRRRAELRQNRFARAPRTVNIEQTRLGGVPAELLSRAGNPEDRVILYIHGGGFVVGSVKTAGPSRAMSRAAWL